MSLLFKLWANIEVLESINCFLNVRSISYKFLKQKVECRPGCYFLVSGRPCVINSPEI